MIKTTSKQLLTSEYFIKITKEDLEKKIEEMISDKQIISILEGGKRLRALLAILTFKACTLGNETSEQYQKALEGGVVIELAHAASLVHDDIIDGDAKRRGKTSYHIKNGVANALLTGHKMLVKGFNVAIKHGEEWAKLYANSWNEIINGELDEMELNKNGFNMDDDNTRLKVFEIYNKVINLKTAALFSSVCKAGAIEAKTSGDILKVFADYGREIGMAYQLADDLVDLANGEMIDSVIIPLLNKLGDKTNNKINSLKKMSIKRKFAKNKDEIEKIYLDEIKKHIEKAEILSASDLIPKSQYKDLIAEFPRYIINEMLKEIKISI